MLHFIDLVLWPIFQVILKGSTEEKNLTIFTLLENLLMETYGIVIYQEQVMGVARELSGYTDGEADLLRRAMGKKIQKEMNAQKKKIYRWY